MNRVLVTALLSASPSVLHAQDLSIDPDIVRACFENTDVGAIYPDCLGQAANLCQERQGGSTTVGIVECVSAETAEWDVILNEEYKSTQAANAKQDERGASPIVDRSDALRDAQRAWIAFRDADCAARYAMWQDGTIRSVVSANCHLTMTASRAIELRDMRGF